jgi:preprotein translocase subunit SecB
MKMTEKFKILAKFIRDLSSETPDIETYLFVKDTITKYKMDIDISSKALKNNMIEVNTSLKFEDKNQTKKKSIFEINYVTVIKIDESIKDKKELEKIILCDVQNKIYPDLEKSFLDLIHNSGYPEMRLEKKIDFNLLYNQRIN